MEKIYPFVGMDPYVEAPDIWPDFHDALAGEIRADLNARLSPPYYARLQMRPELGIILEAGSPHRVVPDVVVVRRPNRPPRGNIAVLEPYPSATAGIQVRVRTDPLMHHFVEIRDAVRDHKLVTLIEIVSPSNKHAGPDRRAYETKQLEILESDAHLIELDFVRTGRRVLPYPELDESVHQLEADYLVLLNRSNLRMDNWMDYELFPIELRQALPVIPVPLQSTDEDMPLDLQAMVERAHLTGPYLTALDYTQPPPEPKFPQEKMEWLDARLRAVKLRG